MSSTQKTVSFTGIYVNATSSTQTRTDTVYLKVKDNRGAWSDTVSKSITSWNYWCAFTNWNERIQDVSESEVTFLGEDRTRPADRVKNRKWTMIKSWGYNWVVPTVYGDKVYSVTIPVAAAGSFIIALEVDDGKGHKGKASERFFALKVYQKDFGYGYKSFRSYVMNVDPTNKLQEVPKFSPTWVYNDLIKKIDWVENRGGLIE